MNVSVSVLLKPKPGVQPFNFQIVFVAGKYFSIVSQCSIKSVSLATTEWYRTNSSWFSWNVRSFFYQPQNITNSLVYINISVVSVVTLSRWPIFFQTISFIILYSDCCYLFDCDKYAICFYVCICQVEIPHKWFLLCTTKWIRVFCSALM